MSKTNDELQVEALAALKMMLSITDDTQDELLNMYLTLAKNAILDYCNIDLMPERLLYTWAEFARDIDIENKSNSASVAGDTGAISSVSEGGKTISFATSTSADSLIMFASDRVSKMTVLTRYKKLYRG